MSVELKHVQIDPVEGRKTVELVEIAADCDALKAAVQAELKRQRDERDEALKAVGALDVETKPTPAKRGPKPKSTRETEIDVALEDAEPAQISGRA